MSDWTRIPLPIDNDRDRRELAAILISAGLEVRVAKVRATPRGTPRKHVEYRMPEGPVPDGPAET